MVESLSLQEFSLNQKLEEAERGTQLLSHALADRTAQLQIQETKTKVGKTFIHSRDRGKIISSLGRPGIINF